MIAKKLTTIAENVPKVYEQGYEDAWDLCWDCWQKWGTKDDYYAVFQDWKYEDIKPKHTIFGRLQSTFQGTKGEHFEPSEIKLSFAKCTNLYQMLYRATFKTIGVIDLSAISQAVNTGSMFNQMENLERVEKIIMPSKEYLNPNDNFLFYLCSKLTHIIFEGELVQKVNFMSSPLLDDESIQSIIDALADLSGGTAQTLTLHSTVKSKLTESQLSQISSKNWILA